MFSTYNMGIGMMMAVEEKDAEKVAEAVRNAGYDAWVIGKMTAAEKDENGEEIKVVVRENGKTV